MPESPRKARRIFLSYGHDEHAAMASRLKKDLSERGHEVWMDADHLRPGTPDWEHAIEKGIQWATQEPDTGIMVFVVTPHSARRPDGFCLNELSRALEKKLPIVPVMLVWCELPLSICRIQWLDMQDCLPLDEREERYAASLARLCETLEHDRLDFEGGQSRLQSLFGADLLAFEADLERHLVGFTGRQWLMDAVDAWLADPDAGRLFWLTGRPGSGKTAFASWLCRHRREVAAFFLCDWQNVRKSDPRQCVLSIAWQLSTQLHEYHVRLNGMDIEKLLTEADPLTLFDVLVAQPISINFPQPDRHVVIVIDALDEATRGGRNQIAEFLAKCLEKVPRWFKAIITSRPEQEVLYPLQGFSPLTLDTFSQQNLEDIRAYLRRHLPEAVPDAAVQAICDRSDGIFLYASWVVEELRQGRLRLDRLDDFPKGLGGCYAGFFTRQFPLDAAGAAPGPYKTTARPLLEIMAAARNPLHLDHAASVLGWDEYDAQEHVARFGSLLTSSQGLLQPFHRTLMEWLTARETAGKYLVSADAGHRRLADAGWVEFQSGPERMGEYAGDHLAAHLIAAKRWDDVKAFLSHPAVMRRTMAEDRQYELLGHWLAIGDNLDMVATYEEAIAACEQEGLSEEEQGELCVLAASYFETAAKLETAITLARKSLNLQVAALGEEHPDVGQSLSVLAHGLRAKGGYQEAEPLYRRALALQEKALGGEHPVVATCLNNLGGLLSQKGDLQEAETLLRRALAIWEKALGGEHPNVADSLNNLANLLSKKGDLQEAEPLYRRALAIREKALGEEHPNVAHSLNNLALLLSKRGDLKEAEPLYRRALAIWEKALGGEHPVVATCLNNLANLLSKKGDLQEAEPLYRRALAIREKALGGEHPDVAHSLNNLALLLSKRGDLKEAEPLYRRALAIREKALGEEHPDVSQSLNNLAWLLSEKGDLQEAEPLYRRALAIREKALDEEHPDVATSLNNLAVLLSQIGNFQEAEPLYRRALAIREKALGEEHPNVAHSLNNLALLLSKRGDLQEAEPLYRRALAIREKALDEEHPDVAISLNNLAALLSDKGDYQGAEPLYRRALAIREKALDEEHPDVVQSLKNLADLLSKKGDYQGAEPLYRRTLAIREKTLSEEHPDVAACLYNLSLLIKEKGSLVDAILLSTRALNIYEKTYGADHHMTKQCLDLLNSLQSETTRHSRETTRLAAHGSPGRIGKIWDGIRKCLGWT